MSDGDGPCTTSRSVYGLILDVMVQVFARVSPNPQSVKPMIVRSLYIHDNEYSRDYVYIEEIIFYAKGKDIRCVFLRTVRKLSIIHCRYTFCDIISSSILCRPRPARPDHTLYYYGDGLTVTVRSEHPTSSYLLPHS